jgi:hypothetical protein
MKKPDRKWVAILVVVTGMAWGAATAASLAPQHAFLPSKSLIPGG